MKKNIILLMLLACIVVLKGQTNINSQVQLPTLMPKSPEVQSFEKYGSFSVNEYTGTPSIDLPLYSIKVGSIEFPISINYNASGIQVSQEATWIGLGWSLFAGGCISTIPVGAIDGSVNQFDNVTDWNKLMNYMPSYSLNGFPRRYIEDGVRLWECSSGDGKTNSMSQTPDDLIKNGIYGNGERDVYSAFFLGHSFKFSIHPVSKDFIILGEKNKFKIQNENSNWVITDEFGVQYYFSNQEIISIPNQSTGSKKTTTWYLSSIKSQDSEITLKYHEISNVKLLPSIIEWYDYNYPFQYDGKGIGSPSRSGDIKYLDKQLYVSTIETGNQLIKFITKPRVDIRNGLALDMMQIIDKINQKIIKQYKFNHDYFVGKAVGTDVKSDDYIIKRLKLTGFSGGDEIKQTQMYGFTYDESIALPYKTSFSQDYWGYFNGEENKIQKYTLQNSGASFDTYLYPIDRTLLPMPKQLFMADSIAYTLLPNDMIDFVGANRASSRIYMTSGMLKSITYPTGGKSVFEFEPHTFNNGNYPCVEDIKNSTLINSVSVNVLSNNNDVSHGKNNAAFRVLKGVKAKITVVFRSPLYSFFDMYPSQAILFGNMNGGMKFFKMKGSESCTGTVECDMNIFNKNKSVKIEEYMNLVAGQYSLNASLASKIPNQVYNFATAVDGKIEFTEYLYDNIKKLVSYGGGVRVKRITNYSNNNDIISTKNYNYIDIKGKTSGKLIYPLRFYYEKNFNVGYDLGQGNYTRLNNSIYKLSSSNKLGQSPHSCGVTIGYDRVEIIESINQSTIPNNGKEILEFINITNSKYLDFIFPVSEKQYCNGKMSKKILLDDKLDTLLVEKNTYDIYNFQAHYINMNVTDNYIGPTNICKINNSTNPLSFQGRFDIITYPTNNYSIYLEKKEEIQYLNKNKVNKITLFEYNNNNYRIKKTTEKLYEKDQITEFKYPDSFTNIPVFSTMITKNMLSNIIEESSYIGSLLINNKKTNYSTFGNLIAPSSILFKNENLNEESRIQFLNYNLTGAPVYILKDNLEKIIYLWSYNGQYPVAEIKNATYTEVNTALSKLGLTSIDEVSKSQFPNINKIGDLRTELPNALVSVFSYKPLVGMLTSTDPSGIITYYDYDYFGRLKETYIMENGVKTVLQSHDYHYKNQ